MRVSMRHKGFEEVSGPAAAQEWGNEIHLVHWTSVALESIVSSQKQPHNCKFERINKPLGRQQQPNCSALAAYT